MRITWIILVLICLHVITAQSDAVLKSEELTLDVTLSTMFDVVPTSAQAKLDYVLAKLSFYPQVSTHHEILSIDTSPSSKLEEGDYVFRWDNPGFGEQKYALNARVKTHFRYKPVDQKIKFPIVDLDPELDPYLEPTEKIDITPKIIEQASLIAQGSNDLFEVVFRVASWTKENIDYNLTTVTANAAQSASWTLENRYGVCDEMTNLMIAMLRSLGIPARFVSGISYTDSKLFDEPWGLHGWAEVYFPQVGWVSFDPTYGQYGAVDATHIKLRDALDSDKSSARYEWRATDTDILINPLDIDVEILDQKPSMASPLDVEISSLAKNIGFGSYDLLEATIKNTQDFYVASEMHLIVPEEVRIISEPSQFISLGPQEEKSVIWVVHVNDDLDPKYVYTLPYQISSSLYNVAKSQITARSTGVAYSYNQIIRLLNSRTQNTDELFDAGLALDCKGPSIGYTKEDILISCQLKNTGTTFLKDIEVCIDECIYVTVGIGQAVNQDFKVQYETAQNRAIIITAKGSGVDTSDTIEIFVDVLPKLSISNFNFPDPIVYGPPFDVSFSLQKQTQGTIYNATVSFFVNTRETTWHFDEIEANQDFQITLDKTLLKSKENIFAAQVEYHDQLGRSYKEFARIDVAMQDLTFMQKIEVWLNQLGVKISNIFS